MNMKLVTTLFSPKEVINKNSEINNIISPICILRRRSRKCLYQEGQYESIISMNSVKDFTCLNESFSSVGTLLERIRPCLILQVRKNDILIPEATDCIKIDSELHVQLLFKGVQWFHDGGDCCLSSKVC